MDFDPAKLPPYEEFRSSAQEVKMSIEIVTTTPMLGGGVQARTVDDVDAVRVPSIRGQLRFWWRALFAGTSDSVGHLYQQERDLWGGLGGAKDHAVRSKVSLAVKIARLTDKDLSPISLQQADAYALWTARGTRGDDPAPRRRPGTRVILIARAPSEYAEALRATLRAWLLFGGIGGRTRRGCGALALATPEARDAWLPPDMTEGTLRGWLAASPAIFKYVPSLHRARYQVGSTAESDAAKAWHLAIAWLRDFRQGTGSSVDTAVSGDYARQRPSLSSGNTGRPGRTRWPEPDKIRHKDGPRSFDHTPLPGHGSASFWPRADFGLPIEVRFQTQDRYKQPFSQRPPRDVKLGWTDAPPAGPDVPALSRLASPLIVKPVQLRDGSFLPLALWLSRSLPQTAMVGIHRNKNKLDSRSLSPFGVVLPPGDTHLFLPLAGKGSLRDAFMDWVAAKKGVAGGIL